jgi:hypothetical protein
MERTRGAELKKGSALCEIKVSDTRIPTCQRHLGGREGGTYLVKLERAEGHNSRDWQARPASIKGWT